MPPFAASFLGNFRRVKQIRRKRVGVEPTIRPAKGRIAGFEDREGHRTPFASGGIIGTSGAGFQSRPPACAAGRPPLRTVWDLKTLRSTRIRRARRSFRLAEVL